MATVEMAVIMPITVMIICLVMYLGFYLYDRTALYCDSYIASQSAVENPDMENMEAMGLAMGKMAMLLENQLIALEDVDYKVSVTYDNATVGYEGQLTVPFIKEDGLFGNLGLFDLNENITSGRHRPVTDIRFIRKLSGLADKIKKNE